MVFGNLSGKTLLILFFILSHFRHTKQEKTPILSIFHSPFSILLLFHPHKRIKVKSNPQKKMATLPNRQAVAISAPSISFFIYKVRLIFINISIKIWTCYNKRDKVNYKIDCSLRR